MSEDNGGKIRKNEVSLENKLKRNRHIEQGLKKGLCWRDERDIRKQKAKHL